VVGVTRSHWSSCRVGWAAGDWPLLRVLLSLGLELDVLDGDAIQGELEVVDGAHDGGLKAVGEDLGGERVWGLDEKDASGPIEGQGIGVGRARKGQSSEQPIPLTSEPKNETELGYSSSPSPSRRSLASARRQRRRHQDWIRARW